MDSTESYPTQSWLSTDRCNRVGLTRFRTKMQETGGPPECDGKPKRSLLTIFDLSVHDLCFLDREKRHRRIVCHREDEGCVRECTGPRPGHQRMNPNDALPSQTSDLAPSSMLFQGISIINEYATRFEYLSHFFSQPTFEEWKCRKFKEGLRQLKRVIILMAIWKFLELVEKYGKTLGLDPPSSRNDIIKRNPVIGCMAYRGNGMGQVLDTRTHGKGLSRIGQV
ncbi:hypothetical protein CR513_32002, partial [Mucuna pruriens]